MFHQILVPTDFSKKHTTNLDIAINIATRYNGTIHVINIIEIIPDTTILEYGSFYGQLEARAQEKMEHLVSSHSQKEVNIIPHIAYGNRVQEILKYARANKIDLIIMNSQKIDLKNHFQNWGTISHQVSFLSDVPVMLVK